MVKFAGMSGDTLANPPKLKPGEYATWVVKFESHVLALDGGVWQVIEQGRKIVPDPNDATKEKPRSTYTAEDYKSIEKTAKAMKVLHSALEPGDMQKVSHLRCPKQIWDTLKRIYEGSEDVRKNRTLAAQTDLFNLKQAKNETIHEYHSKFQGCLSGLANLEKTYEQWEINHMFLRSLASEYNDVVRTFQVLSDVKNLSLEDLVAKIESSMLLERDRESHKPSRQIALGSKGDKPKSSKDKDSTDKGKGKSSKIDDDELALLTKTFKFLKGRREEGQEPQKSRRIATKDDECFYCKKKGHFKADCRKKKYDESQKKDLKPRDDKQKDKKAMYAWGGSGGSLEDSDPELESKYPASGSKDFCLMADQESSTSEVSSSTNSSLSSNNISHAGLMDTIRRLVATNDRMKNVVAERDEEICRLREENHYKTSRVRHLESQIVRNQKSFSGPKVQEPPKQSKVHVSGKKMSKPELTYGKVALLKRPHNCRQPSLTPRLKIDLQDGAKVQGKGFKFQSKFTKKMPVKEMQISIKKTTPKKKELSTKTQRLCHHCGQTGHMWRKCPGREFFRTNAQTFDGKVVRFQNAKRQASLKKVQKPCQQAKVPKPCNDQFPRKVHEPSKTAQKEKGVSNSETTSSNIDSFFDNISTSCVAPKAAKLVWVRKN